MEFNYTKKGIKLEQPTKNSVNDLFSSTPTVVKEADPNQYEELVAPPKSEKPYMRPEMSAAQIKDREERTVFVGNVDLKAKKKQIKKYLTPFGKVEKVWIRSVPTVKTKVPKKGQVVMENFVEGADSKNAYVLFEDKEGAKKALEADNTEFRTKHIRVTPANVKEMDVKTSIFIGNLSYKVKEEELRKHFSQCGEIARVRIIRDPVTFKGKGFGYIKFATQQGYLEGLKMNKSEFLGRELRVSKAVDMEKKKKKQFKRQERRVNKFKGKGEQNLIKTKSKIMKKFARGAKMDNEMDETKLNAIFKHDGVVPQTMIGKKIKKLKKKGYSSQKLHRQILKVKAAAHKKLEDQVFTKGDMMKKRREDRKKKAALNSGKARSFKNAGSLKSKAPKMRKVEI